MTRLDLTTVKVGQLVAVAREGSWETFSEGEYVVKAANKVKVVVRSTTTEHERTFSVKKGTEMGSGNKYYAPYLEDVAAMQARAAKNAKRQQLANAWAEVARTANSKNLTALRELVSKLEELTA
jgi:hypothetical protein